MSALGSDNSSLHTCRSSANDKDLLFERRGANVLNETCAGFAGYHWIYGAYEVHMGSIICGAVAAADAGSYLVCASGSCLFGEERIGNETANHRNAVSFSAGNNFLSILRSKYCAYNENRNIYSSGLFDRLRELNIQAAGTESGRNEVPKLLGGDLNKVHILLRLFKEVNGEINFIAALKALRTAETDLNKSVGTCMLSHAAQALKGKTHPIFGASAILIRTLIDHRREELGEKPVMTKVDEESLETCLLPKVHIVTERLNDLLHILFGHSVYLNAIGTNEADRPDKGTLIVGRLSSLSIVAKLNSGNGAVLSDSAAHLCVNRHILFCHSEMAGMSAAVIHGDFAQRDLRGSATGLLLEIAYIVIIRQTVYGLINHTGTGEYSVFENISVYLQGFEKIWIKILEHFCFLQ